MSPEPRPSAKAIKVADDLLAKTLPAWTGMLESYASFRSVQAMKGVELHPLEMPIDMVATLNKLPREGVFALLTVALWHEHNIIATAQKGSSDGLTEPQGD